MNSLDTPAPESQESNESPVIEGEGNYTAARRHRESVKRFIDSGKVADAARDAQPVNEAEARELREAEAEGESHGKP